VLPGGEGRPCRRAVHASAVECVGLSHAGLDGARLRHPCHLTLRLGWIRSARASAIPQRRPYQSPRSPHRLALLRCVALVRRADTISDRRSSCEVPDVPTWRHREHSTGSTNALGLIRRFAAAESARWGPSYLLGRLRICRTRLSRVCPGSRLPPEGVSGTDGRAVTRTGDLGFHPGVYSPGSDRAVTAIRFQALMTITAQISSASSLSSKWPRADSKTSRGTWLSPMRVMASVSCSAARSRSVKGDCRPSASLLPELLLTLEASAGWKHGWRSKWTKRIQECLCERRKSKPLALGARGPQFESGRPDQMTVSEFSSRVCLDSTALKSRGAQPR
jgi:hypothetical protein